MDSLEKFHNQKVKDLESHLVKQGCQSLGTEIKVYEPDGVNLKTKIDLLMYVPKIRTVNAYEFKTSLSISSISRAKKQLYSYEEYLDWYKKFNKDNVDNTESFLITFNKDLNSFFSYSLKELLTLSSSKKF